MSDHSRIKALFNTVADAADPELALRNTDATPEEAARVLRLLGHANEPTRFSAPVVQAAQALKAPELQPGDRLGAWLLGEPLGEGGMGLVFSAERDDGHYRQRAAVKLLRGWSGHEGLARLARERQILASLNHPHIARLLDGGTTPAGRPYLVMEFVDGLPIDAHAEARGLGLNGRLGLFEAVCDAVAHAHARLVIHCDIKPGNVLVNHDGQVKLLDFGIAQLAGQGDAEDFSPAATPGFAPPEQMAGGNPAPAWDVFALGRLLERLCGEHAGRRGAELQAVVARACAKDPTGRYPGVPALAEELRRLRHHEPLVALRGSSPLYAMRKWMRRRWPWALTGTLVLGGSAGFTYQLMLERNRARQEASTTREVSEFVVSLFEGADPSQGGSRHDVTARELLDRGRARLEAQLQAQPEQRARLLEVLGDVYERLGDFAKALEAFDQALKMGDLPPEREASLQSRRVLLLANTGLPDEAIAAGRRALALGLAQRPPDQSLLATIENRLGIALTNKGSFAEAEPMLQSALARYLKAPVQPNSNTGSVMHNLARLAVKRGDLAGAEEHFRRALAVLRQTTGLRADVTLDTQTQLARLLADRHQFPEALSLLREATAAREAVWGPQSEHLAAVLNELGSVELDAGDAAAAGRTLRRAVELAGQLAAGSPSRRLAITQHNLAKALMAVGHAGAGDLLRASVAERLRVSGRSDAAFVQPARTTLLRWLLAQRELTEAQAVFDALWVERSRRAQGDADRLTAELLGVELAMARMTDATGLPERLDALQREALTAGQRAHALRLRALYAERAGDAALALRWSREAWAALQESLVPGHPSLLPFGLEHERRLRAGGLSDEVRALRSLLEPAAARQAPGSRWRQDWLQAS